MIERQIVMRRTYLFFLVLSFFVQPLWGQQICRVDTTFEYDYIDGTSVKELKHRIITSYNNFNQISSILREDWNSANNAYNKDTRTDYTYNSQGLESEKLIFEYRSNTAYLISKSTKVYNSANLLEEEVIQRAPKKFTFIYNGNDSITQELDQSWNSNLNSWQNFLKSERTYVSGGPINKLETFFWQNNNWVISSVFDLVYNAQG